MIKIGFIGAVSKEWMGGLNYFNNLLFAINSLEKKELEIFVFVGKKTDNQIKNMFKKYSTVIEDSVFDRKSLKWFAHKLENKLLKTNILLQRVLTKNNIKVLSHTSITQIKSIKTINWIPDFQHLHLPSMFTSQEIKQRNESFMNLIKNSDRIVLSSFDALKDLKVFAPAYISKVDVLQFVSQPNEKYFELNNVNETELRKKYNITNEFLFMPNQFWKHKNHMLVFEAVNKLKKEGVDICLVCTGYLDDYRNKTYITDIKSFIKTNKLENNIKLLGLIDYADVFVLMKLSKVVINPSLFEGCGSTVEECKSVGKNLILSNIDVHKEQYPQATFFDKYSSTSLQKVMANYQFDEQSEFTENLEYRTKLFAQTYINIVKQVLN